MTEEEKRQKSEPLIIRAKPSEPVFYFFMWVMISFTLMSHRGSFFSFSWAILFIGIILGIINFFILWRRQLTLTEDQLIYRGIFGTRSIRRKDIANIKGTYNLEYRTNRHGLLKLIPQTADIPPLRIPLDYYTNPALKAWLEGIPDISEIKEHQRRKEISEEVEALSQMAEDVPAFGKNRETRRQNFQSVNMLLLVFAMMGLAFGIILLLFVHRGSMMFWIPVPILALLLLYVLLQPQKILFFRPTDPTSSASACFRSGFIFCLHGLLICLCAMTSTHAQGTENFLYWGLIPAGILLLALRHAVPDLRSATTWIQLAAFLILCAASYSALRMANVFLDDEYDHVIPVKIIEMNGNSCTFSYVKADVRNHTQLSQNIYDRMCEDLADRLAGDTAILRLGPGALGVSWYDVKGSQSALTHPHS